jgi:hypothetical protein
MFKLNENVNTITATADVSVEGYEAIKANTFIPRGHRLWNTYQAWLDLGNTPEPIETVQQRLDRLTSEVRSERNRLLAASDWTQLQDTTVSADWQTYRQSLRDIPDQPDFPESIDWPETL